MNPAHYAMNFLKPQRLDCSLSDSCDATFPQSNPKLDHVVGSISMLEIAVEESIRIVAPNLLSHQICCHTDIKST